MAAIPSIRFAEGSRATSRAVLRVTRWGDYGARRECSALADLIARRFSLHGQTMVRALSVWAEENTVKLGVVLSVEPREPASANEQQDMRSVERDREGRIELRVVSHFTLDEFLFEMPTWTSSEGTTADVLALFFRNAVLDALEHEIDECIFDGGARRFDPHARADKGLGMRRPPFRSRGRI